MNENERPTPIVDRIDADYNYGEMVNTHTLYRQAAIKLERMCAELADCLWTVNVLNAGQWHKVKDVLARYEAMNEGKL
jgi:hypothetical protein